MASAQASPHAGEFSLWGWGQVVRVFFFFKALDWTGSNFNVQPRLSVRGPQFPACEPNLAPNLFL